MEQKLQRILEEVEVFWPVCEPNAVGMIEKAELTTEVSHMGHGVQKS